MTLIRWNKTVLLLLFLLLLLLLLLQVLLLLLLMVLFCFFFIFLYVMPFVCFTTYTWRVDNHWCRKQKLVLLTLLTAVM